MNIFNHRRFNHYLYTFLLGFLLCLLVQFYLQDKFETNFFDNIARNISLSRNVPNEDSSIVDALHVTYTLLSNRSAALKENNQFNYDIYTGSLSNDLLTANGACGSYTAVLANLLITMGYKVRMVQMKVNNIYGGHIITEVSTKKGWVVLDAMYDLRFIAPTGSLASFSDVSGNWSYYKGQTPKGYNKDYRYEGLRYANWGKIPILMPAMKKIVALFIGNERTNLISIRPLFLRKYRFYSLLLIPLILLIAVKLYKSLNAPWREMKVLSLSQHPKGSGSTLQQNKLIKKISGFGLGSILNYMHSNSKSRQMYYSSFLTEINLQPFLDCQNSNGSNVPKTAIPISAFHIPFNAKVQELRSELGIAAHSIKSNSGDVRHDVYFYTMHLYDKKAVVQFHFFDKKYFLCNITFSETDEIEKNTILDILAHKYSIQTHINNMQISADQQGNLLMFDHSVNLNICYMTNNGDIIRALFNHSNSKSNIKSANFRLSNLRLQEIL